MKFQAQLPHLPTACAQGLLLKEFPVPDMTASNWQPVSKVVGPCADISHVRTQQGALTVTMHFSLVVGLPNEDLRLQFPGALAMHWETECPGFFPVPRDMSHCTDSRWTSWEFPLQRVHGSQLLEQFQEICQLGNAPELSHFLLISMNDLVHVIAPSDATAEWIPGLAESGA